MLKNELKKFATFETLITPQIITIVYWLSTIILVTVCILKWTEHKEGVGTLFAVSIIVTRVIFELIMVSFKNNEYLRRICEAAEEKKAE